MTDRTRTDFLALTISARPGTSVYDDELHGNRYRYTVNVSSDATSSRTRFQFTGSIHDHNEGQDQLDKTALLWAFRCFVEDAAAGEQTFGEFCGDYGYDTDSIAARRTWEACRNAGRKFRRLWHDAEKFTPWYVLEQLDAEGIQ